MKQTFSRKQRFRARSTFLVTEQLPGASQGHHHPGASPQARCPRQVGDGEPICLICGSLKATSTLNISIYISGSPHGCQTYFATTFLGDTNITTKEKSVSGVWMWWDVAWGARHLPPSKVHPVDRLEDITPISKRTKATVQNSRLELRRLHSA